MGKANTYDVIVVGARCAGSPIAMLLARKGYKVLLVDRATYPSDTLSTHIVQPQAVARLARWGLLDRLVASGCPPIHTFTFNFGPLVITGSPGTADAPVAYCPRRTVLDKLLVDAAVAAGAELREGFAVDEVLVSDGVVTGVRGHGKDGANVIENAALVVGADGRHSLVREKAGLAVEDIGAPMDALWMRLPRRPDDPEQPVGRFGAGEIYVMLNRGDYYQCALVIPKGGFEALRERGLEALRARIAALAPFVADRVGALQSWDDLKLLTVAVDRLTEWSRPGLLCIGDAAHAMSPVGGVGINLAVQDGVAAANILYRPLLERSVTLADLGAVQRRRELPMRVIQRLQVVVQNRIIGPTLGSRTKPTPPWMLRLFARLPFLRRIPARLIGLGFRPEHIRTPEAAKGAPTPVP